MMAELQPHADLPEAFDLPQKYVPTVACRPHPDSVALDEGRAGQWYAEAFDQLWAAALPDVESTRLITELITETSALR